MPDARIALSCIVRAKLESCTELKPCINCGHDIFLMGWTVYLYVGDGERIPSMHFCEACGDEIPRHWKR